MKKQITGILLSMLILSSCNTTPPADGSIKFVNAVSDSLGMNIFLTGERINGVTPIENKNAFPSLSGYRTSKPSNLTVSLCPALLEICPPVVSNQSINLASNDLKTAFLVGTATISDDNGADPRPLSILTFNSETTAPALGKAKIRVLHAATLPSAKSVGLHVTAPVGELLALPPSLNYKNMYDYAEVDAGSWRIRATVTSTTVVDSGTLTLENGKIYTAMIVNPDVNGLGVVLLTDK
jgi:hypothetical protein